MNLIVAALRHPLTVMVAIVAITLGFALAVGKSVCEQVGVTYPAGLPKGMEVDIFPALNLPVIVNSEIVRTHPSPKRPGAQRWGSALVGPDPGHDHLSGARLTLGTEG